jgi:hypothetical protein
MSKISPLLAFAAGNPKVEPDHSSSAPSATRRLVVIAAFLGIGPVGLTLGWVVRQPHF